jgi:hypothetical protein
MSKYTPGDPQTYGPYDFSVPQNLASVGTGTMWRESKIFARVNGQKLLLSQQEYDSLIAAGADVEVRTPGT